MPLPSEAEGELRAILKAKGITWDDFQKLCYETSRHGSITPDRIVKNLGPAPENWLSRTLEARTGLPEGTPEPKAVPVKRVSINGGARLYLQFKDPDAITQKGSNINLRMHRTLKIKGIQDGISLEDLFKVEGAMYRADIGWALKKGFIRLE